MRLMIMRIQAVALALIMFPIASCDGPKKAAGPSPSAARPSAPATPISVHGLTVGLTGTVVVAQLRLVDLTIDVADDDAGSDDYPYDLQFGDGTEYHHLSPIYECARQPTAPPTNTPAWRPHPLHKRDVIPHRYERGGTYRAVVTVRTRAPCSIPPYGPAPETATARSTIIVQG
ncbi:MAG: hypothetical protein QOE64_319 [Frankiales bacterium]|nr:hypothetical protein [Frankiales bacterium]